tara:strand:+ start:1361 stop:1672 length:312 start_codon:yes stop_codon:yes gene_type:complete
MGSLSINALFKFIESLGLIQIISVIFLCNSPSIIYSITQNNKIKIELKTKYISSDNLQKSLEPIRSEIATLRSSIQDLSKILTEQRISTAQTEAKLKLLNGTK